MYQNGLSFSVSDYFRCRAMPITATFLLVFLDYLLRSCIHSRLLVMRRRKCRLQHFLAVLRSQCPFITLHEVSQNCTINCAKDLKLKCLLTTTKAWQNNNGARLLKTTTNHFVLSFTYLMTPLWQFLSQFVENHVMALSKHGKHNKFCGKASWEEREQQSRSQSRHNWSKCQD